MPAQASSRALFGPFSGPPRCTRTYVEDGAGTSADRGPNILFSSALTFTALTLVRGIPRNSMKSRSSAERPILDWAARLVSVWVWRQKLPGWAAQPRLSEHLACTGPQFPCLPYEGPSAYWVAPCHWCHWCVSANLITQQISSFSSSPFSLFWQLYGP